MATKSGLISAVNGFITSVVSVVKHRNSMLEVINELFPTVTQQNEASTSIITKTYSLAVYDIDFKKQGNLVTATGEISVTGTSINANTILCTFADAVYRPNTSLPQYTKAMAYNSSAELTLQFDKGTSVGYIKTGSIMLPDVIYHFNITYNVAD